MAAAEGRTDYTARGLFKVVNATSQREAQLLEVLEAALLLRSSGG